jgi:hypothetical protein
MSHQPLYPSSREYLDELARNIAAWLPHEYFLPAEAPSGYVSIKIYRFHPEGLDFVVRDPTGGEDRWTVTWRALLAHGAMKRSEN